jgi:hypothetical protein
VEQTKTRLNKVFTGFDSIDPRMERIPNDLNESKLRDEYLENHINWFLKNHENAISDFQSLVHDKYGHKQNNHKQSISNVQKTLFE